MTTGATRPPSAAERAAWESEWGARVARLAAECAAELAGLERICVEDAIERGTCPAADSWSRIEVLEHVAIVNRYLLLLAAKLAAKSARRAARGDAWPSRAPDLEALASIETDATPWQAPEHMLPTGSVPAAAVARELAAQRAAIAALLARVPSGQGTLADARMSHLGEGARLDCYGMVEFLRRHARRHRRRL